VGDDVRRTKYCRHGDLRRAKYGTTVVTAVVQPGGDQPTEEGVQHCNGCGLPVWESAYQADPERFRPQPTGAATLMAEKRPLGDPKGRPGLAWIVVLVLLAVIMALVHMYEDERRERQFRESGYPPCLYNPNTGEAAFTPCVSTDRNVAR
jgi:hypothetical protein